LTSTKPSAGDAAFFTHHGNAPSPLCLRTFGALGAKRSASTLQRGLPFPVTPHDHPAGTDPGLSLSKLSVSANAAFAENTVNATMRTPLISFSKGLPIGEFQSS
jgi:hypothetical protein